MKMNVVRGFLVFIMIFMFSASVGANPFLVGIIDVAVIIEQSNAGKIANAALAEEISAKQGMVDEKAAEINALVELFIESDEMSDEERTSLEAQHALLLAEYQELIIAAEKQVQESAQYLRTLLVSEIGEIVRIIAQREGYALILESTSAAYYGKHIDITAEVIREYNKYYQ